MRKQTTKRRMIHAALLALAAGGLVAVDNPAPRVSHDVTVGERIGKSHMTYGMGASAEIVAASTIMLAQVYGLPVSTTHILTSGVAGAAVANGAGLQRRTILHMVAAWLLTLPAAMLLSGGLYWLLLTGIRLFG